jgi:hypothetical protein
LTGCQNDKNRYKNSMGENCRRSIVTVQTP